MFDIRDITEEIKTYAGEFAGDFDIDGIIDELKVSHPDISGIDDIDGDEWTDIMQRHDVSCQR